MKIKLGLYISLIGLGFSYKTKITCLAMEEAQAGPSQWRDWAVATKTSTGKGLKVSSIGTKVVMV